MSQTKYSQVINAQTGSMKWIYPQLTGEKAKPTEMFHVEHGNIGLFILRLWTPEDVAAKQQCASPVYTIGYKIKFAFFLINSRVWLMFAPRQYLAKGSIVCFYLRRPRFSVHKLSTIVLGA